MRFRPLVTAVYSIWIVCVIACPLTLRFLQKLKFGTRLALESKCRKRCQVNKLRNKGFMGVKKKKQPKCLAHGSSVYPDSAKCQFMYYLNQILKLHKLTIQGFTQHNLSIDCLIYANISYPYERPLHQQLMIPLKQIHSTQMRN